MKGYLKSHKVNQIPVNKNYIVKSKFSPNVGYYMTIELLEKFPVGYDDIEMASIISPRLQQWFSCFMTWARLQQS